MAPQALDELGTADDDAGLRAAEQLVTGEADQVGARSQARTRDRLVPEVDERSGAEVVDEDELVAQSHLCQFVHACLLGEPDHAEIRLVHAQE